MDSRQPSERDRELLRIAGSISDREPVAWEEELQRAPGLENRLGTLRLLASLAQVHEDSRSQAVRDESAATTFPAGTAGLTAEPRSESATATVAGETESLARGTRWGQLQILETLGRGGFGTVYRAFDDRLGREVALKLWRRGRGPIAGQLDEARALARLHHPNLPVVYGVDQDGGSVGMWTELVSGETLEQRLLALGPMSAREAALVGIEVCRALAAIHDAGLVHRDVKTSNVMREKEGRIVLLDLGLVIPFQGSGPESAAGTLPSMAPELFQGRRASPASDVYAAGVLLYRLVTHANPDDPVAGHTARAIPLRERVPDLPPGFCDIVERATAAHPEDRHPNARALETALLEWAESHGVEPRGSATSAASPARTRLLPQLPTSFVGREGECWECLEAVRASRLVTVVGPGGCGKTRLAIHIAEQVAESAETVVGFADLSPLVESATVASEVLRALDLPPTSSRGLRDHVAQVMGDRSYLLVLDNCEHLLDAAGSVADDLLAACPGLRILATSRAPLRLAGERLFELAPLGLPPPDERSTAASVGAFDAVRLFVERARRVSPGFRLTDENAAAVADLCARLDGLPLAIELAAARSRALTPQEIRDRLAAGIGLLGQGRFSTNPRHETLETAVRWTYDALAPDDRRVFDSLAVFAGSWTLEAATRVCLEDSNEIEALERITDLIERSLVVSATPCLGVSRYGFLETLNRFAQERLRESGRLPVLQARHFDFFLALAEQAEPQMWGTEQSSWAQRLEADHPNLLAALAWSRSEPGRSGENLRMAGALARFWTERGHLLTGREALQWALANNPPDHDPRAYARALTGEAGIAVYLFEHEAAQSCCTRALEIYRRLEDASGTARSLVALGMLAHNVTDYPRARACYAEALELYRRLDERRGIASVLNNVGAIAWRLEEWEEARRLHEEAVEHAEAAKDPGLRVLALVNLSVVALHRGDNREAASRMTQALTLVRAHRLVRHAATCLEAAAGVLARHQESARAARLFAAGAQHRARLGGRIEPAWHRAHEPMRLAISRDLGRVRLEEEDRVGRSLTAEAGIDEALRGLELL